MSGGSWVGGVMEGLRGQDLGVGGHDGGLGVSGGMQEVWGDTETLGGSRGSLMGCPQQVLLFLFLACSGIYLTLHVSVGLDQELSMPKVGTAGGQQGTPGHSTAWGCTGTVWSYRDTVAP